MAGADSAAPSYPSSSHVYSSPRLCALSETRPLHCLTQGLPCRTLSSYPTSILMLTHLPVRFPAHPVAHRTSFAALPTCMRCPCRSAICL
jgi:hypothetical protein